MTPGPSPLSDRQNAGSDCGKRRIRGRYGHCRRPRRSAKAVVAARSVGLFGTARAPAGHPASGALTRDSPPAAAPRRYPPPGSPAWAAGCPWTDDEDDAELGCPPAAEAQKLLGWHPNCLSPAPLCPALPQSAAGGW